MKYLKLSNKKKERLPIGLNYVRYYKKTVIEGKPDRDGIDLHDFNAKHFFPSGLYKPISSVIDFHSTTLINDKND